MKPVVFLLSTDAPVPPQFEAPLAKRRLVAIRQDRLMDRAVEEAAGLITCVGADQIDLFERRNAIARMLDSGGRLVVNGHVLRPFVKELARFVPLEGQHRSDYVLTRLHDHPVFAHIPAERLEANRGIAGFYGRGHNPPPDGAVRLTGLGPDRVPIDWAWRRPGGGALFVHSGNDLWGVGDDAAVKQLIAERLVRWCLEGQLQESAT